jgi:cytochrome oxidase Cu insertion factor (SCO1/SenC/PrrC family)
MEAGIRRSLSRVLAAAGLALVVACSSPPPAPVPISTLPEFSLLERDGSTVTRETLAGAPWIADFIFTHCAAYCPRLTARMRQLRSDLPPGVRSVSITVDPERDTPAVLAEYARSWKVEGSDWLFLTGEKEAIWSLIRKGFLLPVEENPEVEASPILHSNRFALVDGQGRIRGTYEAFDEEAMARLRSDLAAVLREERR